MELHKFGKTFFGNIATTFLVKVACKRKLFLIQMFTAKSALDFFFINILNGRKLMKMIFLCFFFFTSKVSAFILPFLLFKGRNQATYNISNQEFSLQLSILKKTKQTIILTMNRVSKKGHDAELS